MLGGNDVYAHVLDDDDDVVVSDDDEVNPSTNVEEMACVFPQITRWGNAGWFQSSYRDRKCVLGGLFRQNGQRPLTIALLRRSSGKKFQRRIKRIFSLLLRATSTSATCTIISEKVVMGHNVYTVGDRVKLGQQMKLRILWRKTKSKDHKADHYLQDSGFGRGGKESSAAEESVVLDSTGRRVEITC
ncbi:hypothetical protein Tco_0419237 [Tanacetum coccineum]